MEVMAMRYASGKIRACIKEGITAQCGALGLVRKGTMMPIRQTWRRILWLRSGMCLPWNLEGTRGDDVDSRRNYQPQYCLAR